MIEFVGEIEPQPCQSLPQIPPQRVTRARRASVTSPPGADPTQLPRTPGTMHCAAYIPAASAGSRSGQQRVAISPQTHERLRSLASRRFRGVGSASKLGSVVLDEYLGHMERVYFGAKGRVCVAKLGGERVVDAVVFDMDGVLCDSENVSREVAVAVFDELYGVAVKAEDFEPFTGTGEAAFLEGVARVYGVTAFDVTAAKDAFFDMYINRGFLLDLKPFPGVEGLVKRVKGLGLKVAVASSADGVKVEANLSAIGLPMDSFDFVTSSDDIVNKKPAPDVFLAAAKGLGVDPTRCVVVEDAAAGVRAAKAAGMRCVAVTTSLSRALLEKEGPDVIRGEPAFISLADLCGEGQVFDESDGAKDDTMSQDDAMSEDEAVSESESVASSPAEL